MKAKKSLGQNFLKSNTAINKIVEAGRISENELILEIGPGKGALTQKLLEEVIVKKAKCVIAIEKDIELFNFLSLKFAKYIVENKLILVNGDALEFDIDKHIGKNIYKLIANIPYNITGAIFKKFLTANHQPKSMVLMVQHEVAKRILARDGKESILSISVKAYGEPQMVLKVPARYFAPIPKVDSAVIAIINISRKAFSAQIKGNIGMVEEKFWILVHAGFAHKRKKLSNNLKTVFSNEKEQLIELKNKRAEELSVGDWIKLTFVL